MGIPSGFVKHASGAVAAILVLALGAHYWRRTGAAQSEREAIQMLPHVDIKAYNDLFLP